MWKLGLWIKAGWTWHPTPVLLPGKSHGQRSLVGCSPWGHEELDTTEWLCFHFSLSCIREGNGNPLQCSCLENLRDGGAWWAAVCGVAESDTTEATWQQQQAYNKASINYVLLIWFIVLMGKNLTWAYLLWIYYDFFSYFLSSTVRNSKLERGRVIIIANIY